MMAPPALRFVDQAYREIAIGALKAGGLTDDELAKVGSVIIGYEAQVAPSTINTYNSKCTCQGGVGPDQKVCIPDGGYIYPDVNVPDVVIDAPVDSTPPVDAAAD